MIEIVQQGIDHYLKNPTENTYVVYGANPKLESDSESAGVVFAHVQREKQMVGDQSLTTYLRQRASPLTSGHIVCSCGPIRPPSQSSAESPPVNLVHAIVPCLDRWNGHFNSRVRSTLIINGVLKPTSCGCFFFSYIVNRLKLAEMMVSLYSCILGKIFVDFQDKQETADYSRLQIVIPLLGAGAYQVDPEISMKALLASVKYFESQFPGANIILSIVDRSFYEQVNQLKDDQEYRIQGECFFEETPLREARIEEVNLTRLVAYYDSLIPFVRPRAR